MTAVRTWSNGIKLDGVVAAIGTSAEDVVSEGVDLVAAVSDRDMPVRSGETRKSRKTAVSGTRGAVGYTSDKAVPLHENLHKRHRRGRAKFLESALAECAPDVRAMALRALSAALQRGTK